MHARMHFGLIFFDLLQTQERIQSCGVESWELRSLDTIENISGGVDFFLSFLFVVQEYILD